MSKISAEELIVVAANRLSVAERELATALAELPKLERADKAMVTERLRMALTEIVAAKQALSTLLDAHPRVGDPAARGEDG
jgi:Lon protease-like protein